MKHNWTDNECLIVCKIFKDYFVDSNGSLDMAIAEIQNQCPLLELGSIRMKISNTVQLCNDYSIKHTCPISTLEHYSQQHLQAFKTIFNV